MFATPLLRRACSFTLTLRAQGGRGGFASRDPSGSTGSGFPRLHGTVTGFKHRRGYGFVSAEGIVGEVPPRVGNVSQLMRGYFFARVGLDGGFYITEGERVSFDVRLSVKERRDAGREQPTYVALSDDEGGASRTTDAGSVAAAPSSSAAAASAADEDEHGHRLVAHHLRLFDLKTMTETPIEPITLRGRIVHWDAAAGVGTVGELDTMGAFHADAPRFFLSLDNADLAPGAELRVGRYVRFCIDPDEAEAAAASGGDASTPLRTADSSSAAAAPVAAVAGAEGAEAPTGELHPLNIDGLPVARRAIIDFTMERRNAVVGRPLAPAGAPRGSVSAQTRFHGAVRSLSNGFGFVTDDLSGESIFFHESNATHPSARNLQVGERVTYLLRELTHGRHAGKKACFEVRRESSARRRRVDRDYGEEEHEDEEGPPLSSRRGGSGSDFVDAAASPSRRRKMRQPADDDDFDLLD